jgi:hypothetical protein
MPTAHSIYLQPASFIFNKEACFGCNGYQKSTHLFNTGRAVNRNTLVQFHGVESEQFSGFLAKVVVADVEVHFLLK